MKKCDTVVQLSPHLCHASVCLCSSLCAQSRPEGQTDVVNTSESPSRINQLHKHALCTQDKPLHHSTSAVAENVDSPPTALRILAKAKATAWESISHCYGWPSNDISPFK